MNGSVKKHQVDNDKTVTRVIREAFSSLSREGVESHPGRLPGPAFMDIEMPVIEGFQETRRVSTFDLEARMVVPTFNHSDMRAGGALYEGPGRTIRQKPLRIREIKARVIARPFDDSTPQTPSSHPSRQRTAVQQFS